MTAMGISSRIGQACLVLVLYLHVCDALSATQSTRANRDARTSTPATRRHPFARKCDLVPQCQRYHGNLVLASSTAHGEARASWHTGYNRVTPPSKQQQQTATTTVRQRQQAQAQIRKDYSVPSITDVLAFAIPAVGVWLCVPLLSMIDTSIVGLVAGTAQQAALNPAIAVINYSAKLMTFLFSGTTTMIAAALERDRRDNELTESLTDNDDNPQPPPKRRTVQTLVGALQLSTLVGAGLGAAVFVFARQLLGALVGAAVDPTILTAAMKYVRIRALGLAAAAMVGSAQTACLAQGDVRMPLYATLLSAVTNLILNLLLIRSPQSGAAGAAWATTLSQYIAAAWVVAWLMMAAKPKEKPTRIPSSSSLERPPPKQQSTTGGFVCQSTRGFLAGRIRLGDWIKLPSKSIFRGFAPFVIPVITTQAGRASASATIDHVVSSSLCTASMAANQILTSVYYGLVPVAESLSLAAQNFVPGILEREDHRRRGEQAFAMRKLLMSFLKAAGLCGVVLATIMGTLPLYAGAFTSDAAVRVLVSAVVPLIFVTCLKHGLFCASEGILLGQKDLKFLGTQYGIYTFLIPYILLQLKKAAIGGSTRVSLVSVWQVFLGYDLFRTVLMVGRILWLERKRGSAVTAEAI